MRTPLLGVAAATVACVGLSARSTPPADHTPAATVADLLALPRPAVIAHRGFSAIAPENTIAAVEASIDAGAGMVEVDVLLSADGAVVCIHDDTVDRTTDGSGRVAELTLAELKRLDAGGRFDRRFRDERIPTLDEVLAVARGRILVNVEIKEEAPVGIVPRVAAAIRGHGMEQRVLLSSFAVHTLRRAVTEAPEIPRALLVDTLRGDTWQLAREIGVVAVNPKRKLADEGFVAEAHRRGMAVLPYTVNRRRAMERLIRIGVDGVFTDRPDRLLEVVADQERSKPAA